MFRILIVSALLSLLAIPFALAADDLKAFPPAEAGQVRYVLYLPELPDELGAKVELIIGRTVETDPDNRYFFGGTIAQETIEGWGYTCYKVSHLGPMAGTLMAVDPGAPKVPRFIPLANAPYLIRYNSRLPVVIYVPEDAEVRYRLWRADEQTLPVEKG